jgi:acyl carrier protein
MSEIIRQQIVELVVAGSPLENCAVKDDSTLVDDLGFDSLGLVELKMSMEENFNIEIPDEDTTGIRVVKDIVDYVTKHAA